MLMGETKMDRNSCDRLCSVGKSTTKMVVARLLLNVECCIVHSCFGIS